MKLVRKRIYEFYHYDGEQLDSVTKEEIRQYHYDSEYEKKEHAELMLAHGFEDSGQQKENIGSVMEPKYVWFGSYVKNTKI